MNKKEKFEVQVVAELAKHGWEVDPRDNPNVVIARRAVKTFNGMDSAMIHPVVVHEDGLVTVHAEFTSKGENALSLCHVFLKTEEEIPAKIAAFHEEIMKWLAQAYSVRIAS